MISPINSSYCLLTFPQDRFLNELLQAGNEAHVIHFLKTNKIDLSKIEFELPFDAPAFGFNDLIGTVKLVHYFALKGWHEGLKYLYEQGCDMNANIKDIEHWTPLVFAFSQSDHKTFSLLLNLGAEINQPIPQRIFEKLEQKRKDSIKKHPNPDETLQISLAVFKNTLPSIIGFTAINNTEWQEFLTRKEIKVTIGLLYISFNFNNIRIFESLLNNFSGDINSKLFDDKTILLKLICLYIQTESDSLFKCIQLLLNHPHTDFKEEMKGLLGLYLMRNSNNSLKLIHLLISHPRIDLKAVSSEGFSFYKSIITLHPDRMKSELAQKIHELSDNFGEIIALQTLQLNRIGAELYTNVDGKLINFQVGSTPFNFQEISNSLNAFVTLTEPGSLQYKKSLSEIMWPCGKEMDLNELQQAFLEGKIIVLATGWRGTSTTEKGHSVGCVVYINNSIMHLMICNRGEGTSVNESGITIYKTKETDNKEEWVIQLGEFINILNLLQSHTQETKEFLMTGIHKSSLLEKICTSKYKAQHQGNCTWISPKTTVRGCLIAAMHKDGVDFEQAIERSLENFKEWAHFDRYEHGWKRFLTHPYCQKPIEQREAEGVLISRTIQEYVMHVPRTKRSELLKLAGSCMHPEEFKQNFTPLCCALLLNDCDLSYELIEDGADITVKSASCYTPLHLAAWSGDTEVVELLLQKGAKSVSTNLILPSPAHLAFRKGHRELAKILIEHTPDINFQDQDKKTFLHYACEVSDFQLIKDLLNRKADPNIPKQNGQLPLHHLFLNWDKNKPENQKLEIITSLAKKTNLNLVDEDGHMALHHAVLTDDLAIVEMILQHGCHLNVKNIYGNTPFHLACGACGQPNINEKIIELLLNAGCVHSIKNIAGLTPLILCVQEEANLNIAKILLKKGADPDVTANSACSALHYAAMKGFTPIIDLLLEWKANPNLQTKELQTPLHVFFNRKRKHHINVDKLIEASDLTLADSDGYTPLHEAIWNERSDLAMKMINKGCSINKQDKRGQTALHISASKGQYELCLELIKLGANPNLQTHTQQTPLWFAVMKKDINLVKMLAPITNLQLKTNEESILHTAIEYKSIEIFECILKQFLEKDQDLNLLNDKGMTPLHLSVLSKEIDPAIIIMLIDAGANPNILMPDGKTVLQIAKESEKTSVVAKLESLKKINFF